MSELSLRMTGAQYQELRSHLFPGDGLEAVALLICGRREGKDRTALTTRRVVPVPYNQCSMRATDRVVWSTDILDEILGEVWKSGNSLVKVHSHPTDYPQFSHIDDQSDRSLSTAWDGLFGEGKVHGSAVMLTCGRLFGRSLVEGKIGKSLTSILVAGNDIYFWNYGAEIDLSDSQQRHQQAFGKGTMQKLRALRIGVVGCSGTGSIVIEQLLRLGVGELVLVDPDIIEDKNLNRILNSTATDVSNRVQKVKIFERLAEALGQGQKVTPIPNNLDSIEAVEKVAQCDIVFGCVDTAEGRNLLNRIASYYVIPYIDVGVSLVADGEGSVDTVAGAVHYYAPGGVTLFERGAYTMEQVRAESTKRTNPELYAELRESKYIQGVNEDRPAVITVNMFFASLAVNELLARLHCFRNMPNSEFNIVRGDLCEWVLLPEHPPQVSGHLVKELGKGDLEPLLERPTLSRGK